MPRRREPAWVQRLVVEAVHIEQLREHGGLRGIRDKNTLESALARPRNRWHYKSKTDFATLAAAYGWGLATSHPFRDGNKRVAFLTMAIFLELNGYRLEVSDEDVVRVMLATAAGRCTEEELAVWVRHHLRRIR
jgi:death-on-curing protein